MVMVRDQRWKYIYVEGLAPMLYDLQNYPHEFHDFGTSLVHAGKRETFQKHLLEWLVSRKYVTGISHSTIESWSRKEIEAGIEIGAW